jgi:hypothetical protein
MGEKISSIPPLFETLEEKEMRKTRERGIEESQKKFHKDEEGRVVDDEGNVYDKKLNIVQEAPSEELLEARRKFPDWSDKDLAAYVVALRSARRKREARERLWRERQR